MDETKVIYHIDDEDTPYLIKLPFSPEKVSLGDLKNALNKHNYKYFFKSMDDDFGVVKEEIIDDTCRLPYFNGRVVCWLVAVEGSTSDNQSQCTETGQQPVVLPDRTGAVGDSRPPSLHTVPNISTEKDGPITNGDAIADHLRQSPQVLKRPEEVSQTRPPLPPPVPKLIRDNMHPPRGPTINGHRFHNDQRMHGFDATSSVLSSDLETTSFLDSEDDSRFSTASEATSMSSRYYKMRRRRPNRHRLPPMSRTTSFSSITDSTMSLNIITVTLNLDTVTFLGISIVGQSNRTGDGGIYVGSIMKGGAVALDGRIEPGDMILEVNGVSFENMSNDDAVRTLREAVQKPGPITLVVAKCWDPNPKGYFAVPHQEAVRPIDPSAWVAHTEAARSNVPRNIPYAPSLSTVTSTSSSLVSSMPPEPERLEDRNLTTSSDMATVVRAMAQPESGLEIRDRMWLKITIPSAFIGSELVDWLHSHVQGFANRSDARKYASNLLREGLIRHAVNKTKFSEQCYYVFGDTCVAVDPMPAIYPPPPVYSQAISQYVSSPLTNNLSSLALEDIDSVSEVANKDHSMPSAPVPRSLPIWPGQYSTNPYGPSYLPPMAPPLARNYALPVMHGYDPASYVSGGQQMGNMSVVAESIQSSAVPGGPCACLSYRQLKRLWSSHNRYRNQNANDPPVVVACARRSPPPSGGGDSGLASGSAAGFNCSTSSSGSSTQSSNSQKMTRDRCRPGGDKGHGGGMGSRNGSDTETGSIVGPMRSFTVAEKPLSPPPPINLGAANSDLAASRQSFRMAMGNAYTDDTLQCMGDL